MLTPNQIISAPIWRYKSSEFLKLRKALGLSLDEMASLLWMSRSSYIRLEKRAKAVDEDLSPAESLLVAYLHAYARNSGLEIEDLIA